MRHVSFPSYTLEQDADRQIMAATDNNRNKAFIRRFYLTITKREKVQNTSSYLAFCMTRSTLNRNPTEREQEKGDCVWYVSGEKESADGVQKSVGSI